MKTVQIATMMLLVGTTAFAQDEAARKMATEVAARVPFEKAMKGAPYSADTVIEGSQVLADGNRISRKTTGRVYRDGEGRTRREEDLPDGSVGISITDPVAGFSSSLDPAKKIAWKTSAGGADAIMGKLEATMVEGQRKIEVENAASQRQPSQRTTDQQAAEQKLVAAARGGGGTMARTTAPEATTPLEHKTLEGVLVEGRKTTSVIPAGRIGNEQPLTIVSEEWRSAELNILVQTRHSDPRMGESSYRLLNIVRAEPDASLFMVPPDYTVKETGIRRMEPTRKP
ncbi:MAG: hypothetical protein ABIQ52_03085 [Vicinamibacterales bacterium]